MSTLFCLARKTAETRRGDDLHVVEARQCFLRALRRGTRLPSRLERSERERRKGRKGRARAACVVLHQRVALFRGPLREASEVGQGEGWPWMRHLAACRRDVATRRGSDRPSQASSSSSRHRCRRSASRAPARSSRPPRVAFSSASRRPRTTPPRPLLHRAKGKSTRPGRPSRRFGPPSRRRRSAPPWRRRTSTARSPPHRPALARRTLRPRLQGHRAMR